MDYEQFLAKVRDRGEYADPREAEQVSRIVLARLGERLPAGDAKDVAAQLPVDLQQPLLHTAATPASAAGVDEFLRRLASDLHATEETARWDASAVLTTLADAITSEQLTQTLSQLPTEFAVLFGKPDLA